MIGRNHAGSSAGVTNVSERNSRGSATELLAAMTPSCESASRPRTAPSPQNSATPSATKGIRSSRWAPTAICVSTSATTSPKISSEAAPITNTFTSVCASSHSQRRSGVVASFSKRLPSRWRANSLPTRDSGVNSTTTAR